MRRTRACLGLAALIVVIVPIMVLVAQQTRGQDIVIVTPTLDPLLATATHIVQQATDIAQERMTLTATDYQTDWDSLNITATALVQESTDMARERMTLTENSSPISLDWLQMTATAIVQQATDIAATQLTGTACIFVNDCLSTSVPTPTVLLTTLRQNYINDLTSALGFWHPALDTVVSDYLNSEDETGMRNLHITADVSMTWFAGNKYVALSVSFPNVHFDKETQELVGDRFLLFNLSSG